MKHSQRKLWCAALAARALEIGTEADLDGVPILQMYRWRDRFLQHTPPNQFFHLRDFAGTNAPPIQAPNVTVLHSVAWLDLRREPIVLSWPGGRCCCQRHRAARRRRRRVNKRFQVHRRQLKMPAVNQLN